MLIQIQAQGYPVFLNITLETVQGRERSFIVVKSPKDPPCSVVNIAHQHTPGTSPLKPIVMRPVHPDHLSTMMLTLSPLTMAPMSSLSTPIPRLAQPLS